MCEWIEGWKALDEDDFAQTVLIESLTTYNQTSQLPEKFDFALLNNDSLLILTDLQCTMLNLVQFLSSVICVEIRASLKFVARVRDELIAFDRDMIHHPLIFSMY